MCGVAHAPVLRALTDASGTVSLATVPGLEIGEGKLRLAGTGSQQNKWKRTKLRTLTQTGHSCCACPCRSFGPAAHRRPSTPDQRVSPSEQAEASRPCAWMPPRSPRTHRRPSTSSARGHPRPPLAGATSALSRAQTILHPPPVRVTLDPPPAWAISAPPSLAPRRHPPDRPAGNSRPPPPPRRRPGGEPRNSRPPPRRP